MVLQAGDVLALVLGSGVITQITVTSRRTQIGFVNNYQETTVFLTGAAAGSISVYTPGSDTNYSYETRDIEVVPAANGIQTVYTQLIRGGVVVQTSPTYAIPLGGSLSFIGSSAPQIMSSSGAVSVVSGQVALGTSDAANLAALNSAGSPLYDLLSALYTEMRVNTTVASLGLNVPDDLDSIRNDPDNAYRP